MKWKSYIANQFFMLFNRKLYHKFLLSGQNIEEVQTKILLSILRRNKKTRIGEKYDFQQINGVEDYQHSVPITDYEYYKKQIKGIMDGQKQVLCTERINYLALTSGSVSPSKLIPFTQSLKTEFSNAVNAWIYDLLKSYPKLKWGTQFWIVSPMSCMETSESKIPIGFEPDSSYFGRIERFLIKEILTVPESISKMKSVENYFYAVSLFLLRDKNIRLFSVWNPGMLISIMEYIKNNHEKLIEDIGRGRISLPKPDVQGDRSLIESHFFKNEKRARELSFYNWDIDCFETNEIWPKLQIISCWTHAWAKMFLNKLRAIFPGILIQGKGLLATEGVVSIPLHEEEFPLLACSSHFFEFRSLSSQEIHLAHELQLNECYEVIITTGGGLYRYNLHDKVKVQSLRGKWPMFEFLGKTDKVLDLTGEKINETHVEEIFDKLDDKYFNKEGCVFLSWKARENHYAYVLFVNSEIIHKGINTQDLLHDLDSLLCDNFHYLHSRKMNQLGSPGLVLIDETQVNLYLSSTDRARSTEKHSRLIFDTKLLSEFNNQIEWMEEKEKI